MSKGLWNAACYCSMLKIDINEKVTPIYCGFHSHYFFPTRYVLNIVINNTMTIYKEFALPRSYKDMPHPVAPSAGPLVLTVTFGETPVETATWSQFQSKPRPE